MWYGCYVQLEFFGKKLGSAPQHMLAPFGVGAVTIFKRNFDKQERRKKTPVS